MHDAFALVCGGEGSFVAKTLTFMLNEKINKVQLLRRNVGFQLHCKLVLDWHVSI